MIGMTRDLTNKLRDHLAAPIDSECAVVYLMAEVRKLLERDDKTQRMEALWMYCHWALHIDLHSPDTILGFLKPLDNWVTNKVFGLLPTEDQTFPQEHYLFKDLISLDILKSQLGTFLTGYALPTDLCDDDAKWLLFITAYNKVIEDGTLSLRPKDNSLGAVTRLTIMKGERLFPTEEAAFRVQWLVELKDGRKVQFKLSMLGSGMGSHSIQVIAAPATAV